MRDNDDDNEADEGRGQQTTKTTMTTQQPKRRLGQGIRTQDKEVDYTTL